MERKGAASDETRGQKRVKITEASTIPCLSFFARAGERLQEGGERRRRIERGAGNERQSTRSLTALMACEQRCA